MAAALGDLLRIVDNQVYLEESLMNVYYYRVTSLTGFTDDGYESVLDWFEDNVLAAVYPLQASQLLHTTLVLTNMTNGIDFLERVLNTNGEAVFASSALLPSYVSVGFRLVRESLVTRNGYKRYAGIGDAVIDGNQVVLPTTIYEPIQDALAADIVVGLATLAEPVIVKHPVASPPVASYQYSSIGAAVVSQTPGTQNTRKPN